MFVVGCSIIAVLPPNKEKNRIKIYMWIKETDQVKSFYLLYRIETFFCVSYI